MPTQGFQFTCLPLSSYMEYGLARHVLFSFWNGSLYSTTERFVRGSLSEGSLIMGQRPVAHVGLRGDVVFENSSEPEVTSLAPVRIDNSLTYGVAVAYGQRSQMGVFATNGKVYAPKSGIMSTSGGKCVNSIAYSLPWAQYPGWPFSEVGYRFDGLSLTPTDCSYTMSNRDWRAQPRSDGTGFTSAAGWKTVWQVRVQLVGSSFICSASTISSQVVKVGPGGQLVWYEVKGSSNNRVIAMQSPITSTATKSSSAVPVAAFLAEIERVRLWAIADQYEAEHRQALNDALDEYRKLRSNNIENALQWAKLEKLLPLEAARLLFSAKGDSSPRKKAALTVKAMASLHLWYRYVVKTTYRDLKELGSAIPTLLPKEGPTTLRARVGTSRAFDHFNQTWVSALCRVNPYNLSLLPLRLGLHPGLAQSWDLVPFSFVADWFFGFSNQLNAIDWFIYRSFLRLTYLIRSRRTWVTVSATKFGGAGQAIVSFYRREISFVWPGFADSIPNPRGVPIKNWATSAAALAISCLREPR